MARETRAQWTLALPLVGGHVGHGLLERLILAVWALWRKELRQ